MKHHLAILASILSLLVACTSVQHAELQGVVGRIVSTGVFELDGPYEIVTDAQGNSFEDIPRRDFRQVEHTTRIPMKLGVRFGYDLELRGAPPNLQFALKCVIEHPPMRMPNGTVRTSLIYYAVFESDSAGVARDISSTILLMRMSSSRVV